MPKHDIFVLISGCCGYSSVTQPGLSGIDWRYSHFLLWYSLESAKRIKARKHVETKMGKTL